MWMIGIYSPAGVLIEELPLARDKEFELRLNNWGVARFVLDSLDPSVNKDVLHVQRNEVRIRFGQLTVWAGVLASWRLNQEGDITCLAYSWEWLLTKFFLEVGDDSVDTGYTNEDIGDIITDLIDTHQAKTGGDFGLIPGTIQTSRNATRTDYKALASVWDMIKNLTNVRDGVDFSISPNKEFNVFYPRRGQDRPGVVLDFPGNIKSFRYEEDGIEMVTKLFVKGDGLDDAAVIASATDAQQVAVYGLLHDSRVYSSSNPDVLEEFGRGLLRERNKPQVIIDDIVFESGIEGSPTFTEFGIGDTIRVAISSGDVLNINRKFRVERMTYTIDDQGALDISVGGVYA